MSSPNPFQPPAADVADPSPVYGPVPQQVKWACWLILLSLAIGVATLIPGLRPLPPGEEEAPLWLSILLVLILGGLTVWLVTKVQAARNWARWILFILLATGWALGFMFFPDDLALSPFFASVDLVCVLLEVVACCLLFFGGNARWFKASSR
jgi:hypothetical protein